MPVLRLTLMIAVVLVAGCATHGDRACKAKCEPSPVTNDQRKPEPSRAVPATAAIKSAEPSRAETKPEEPLAGVTTQSNEQLKPEPSRSVPAPATAAIKSAEPSRAATRPEEPLAVVTTQPPKPATVNQAPREQAEQPKSTVAIAPPKPTQTDPTKVSPKPSGSVAPPPASTPPAPATPSAKVPPAGSKLDTIEGKAQAPASKPAATSAPAVAAADQSKAKVVPPPAAAAKPEAAALDLDALEKQLKETKAIGVFTKLTLKNQVDDLLDRFRAYYRGQLKTTLPELRQPYDLLMLKVITLLQDDDPALARTINGSREAIWGILADPVRFSKY